MTAVDGRLRWTPRIHVMRKRDAMGVEHDAHGPRRGPLIEDVKWLSVVERSVWKSGGIGCGGWESCFGGCVGKLG